MNMEVDEIEEGLLTDSPTASQVWDFPDDMIHKILPQQYDYANITVSRNESQIVTAEFRVNITSEEEADEWLAHFLTESYFDFRVLKTYKFKTNARVVYKKQYRCHNNTMADVPSCKTKKPHYKHTACPCTLMITVNNKDMERSSDEWLKSHPCSVTIKNIQHNHNLQCADAVRHRRLTPEIKEKFKKLFESGHSPSSALECHKFNLQMEHGSKYYAAAADGAQCPSLYWCYYMFQKIFKTVYGPQSGELMLKSLENFVSAYNQDCGSTCAKSLVLENDYIVVICTPLMKRVHQYLRSSGEIMFVDSSGCVDRQGVRLFMLMTPSVAGALPLGIILTSSECEKVLSQAFGLYKSILSKSAFYGRGEKGPALIMTDDSTAERQSLGAVFQGSVLLLCIFHVLQAFWRWLLDSKHKIAREDRPLIYQVFKDLLHSQTETDFRICCEEANSHPTFAKYPKLQEHVSDILLRSREWALCFRSSLMTRGNDTNNYCEASMRIFKDKILFRTKAFSLVQLFDFCITRVDAYYQRKISLVLSNRTDNFWRSRYYVSEKMLLNLSCLKMSDDIYLVTNSDTKKVYSVNMLVETCSCPVGHTGAPCKHQFLIVKQFNLSNGQFLPLADENSKKILHTIMNGSLEDVPSLWYSSLRSEQLITNDEGEDPIFPVMTGSNSHENQGDINDISSSSQSEGNVQKCLERLDRVVTDLKQKLEQKSDLYLPAVTKLVTRYETECQGSDNTCVSALHSFNRFKNPKAVRVGTRINVQTTAVGRRKAYLGGGRNLQITGRPPNDYRYAPEHGYSAAPKSSDQPRWQTRRVCKRKKVPHSLENLVNMHCYD